jgi:sugar phosphate isomerase/epimerase
MLADLEKRPDGIWCVRIGKDQVDIPLERFRELGFGFLEIYVGDRLADPAGRDYLLRFVERAGKAGVALWSLHTPFWQMYLSSPDKEEREVARRFIKQAVETAAEAGARYAIVHPGGFTEKGKEAEYDARSVEGLTDINDFCRAKGIRMSVENMPPNHVAGGPRELMAIVDRLPADAGVCLDTGHSLMAVGSAARALETVKKRLFTMHVHDNDGTADQHLIPGEGKGDWKDYVAGLVAAGFEGVFMLEVGDDVPTGETIDKCAAFCGNFLPSYR